MLSYHSRGCFKTHYYVNTCKDKKGNCIPSSQVLTTLLLLPHILLFITGIVKTISDIDIVDKGLICLTDDRTLLCVRTATTPVSLSEV